MSNPTLIHELDPPPPPGSSPSSSLSPIGNRVMGVCVYVCVGGWMGGIYIIHKEPEYLWALLYKVKQVRKFTQTLVITVLVLE